MKKLNLSISDLIALRNHYEKKLTSLNPNPEHFIRGGLIADKAIDLRNKIENINKLIDEVYDELFNINHG